MRVMRTFSLMAVLTTAAACAAGTGTGGGGSSRSSAPDIPPDTSAAVIAEGRALYQSAGARCAGCHGATGQGANNGPNLRDNEWLQMNGGYRGIEYIIRNGVAMGDIRETAHIQPMPARGAQGRLTDEEIAKIATYVWSLRLEEQ
jgi:mono/diheme cytochrome c family protein